MMESKQTPRDALTVTNVRQSLVTIEKANSEIRWRKKWKKERKKLPQQNTRPANKVNKPKPMRRADGWRWRYWYWVY